MRVPRIPVRADVGSSPSPSARLMRVFPYLHRDQLLPLPPQPPSPPYPPRIVSAAVRAPGGAWGGAGVRSGAGRGGKRRHREAPGGTGKHRAAPGGSGTCPSAAP